MFAAQSREYCAQSRENAAGPCKVHDNAVITPPRTPGNQMRRQMPTMAVPPKSLRPRCPYPSGDRGMLIATSQCQNASSMAARPSSARSTEVRRRTSVARPGQGSGFPRNIGATPPIRSPCAPGDQGGLDSPAIKTASPLRKLSGMVRPAYKPSRSRSNP
jgi:hypothetical protein